MSTRVSTGNPLAASDLPAALRAQGRTLLEAIRSAPTLVETLRAADRAEGFVLGLETVGALNADEIEGLNWVFDRAARARRVELGA
jgi:hypothetical protein